MPCPAGVRLLSLALLRPLPDAGDLTFRVVEVEDAGSLGALQTFDDIDAGCGAPNPPRCPATFRSRIAPRL